MENEWLPILMRGLAFPTGSGLTLPVDRDSSANFNQVLSGLLWQAWLGTSAENQGTGSLFLSPVWSQLLELLIRQGGFSQPLNVGGEVSGAYASQVTGKMPVEGRLTQDFHDAHRGLDFGVPVGTPVRTTLSGRVVYAGWNNEGYGNLVIVENGPWRTYYAHLSQIPVRVGQWVAAGEVIGLSGNTGNSTGPHVHYEVRRNGVAVHPRELEALASDASALANSWLG